MKNPYSHCVEVIFGIHTFSMKVLFHFIYLKTLLHIFTPHLWSDTCWFTTKTAAISRYIAKNWHAIFKFIAESCAISWFIIYAGTTFLSITDTCAIFRFIVDTGAIFRFIADIGAIFRFIADTGVIFKIYRWYWRHLYRSRAQERLPRHQSRRPVQPGKHFPSFIFLLKGQVTLLFFICR